MKLSLEDFLIANREYGLFSDSDATEYYSLIELGDYRTSMKCLTRRLESIGWAFLNNSIGEHYNKIYNYSLDDFLISMDSIKGLKDGSYGTYFLPDIISGEITDLNPPITYLKPFIALPLTTLVLRDKESLFKDIDFLATNIASSNNLNYIIEGMVCLEFLNSCIGSHDIPQYHKLYRALKTKREFLETVLTVHKSLMFDRNSIDIGSLNRISIESVYNTYRYRNLIAFMKSNTITETIGELLDIV